MPVDADPTSPVSKMIWQRSMHFRYLVVGAWNTIIGYAIFAILYLALTDFIGYIIIAGISHALAVTQSFITQRKLVFRSSGHWLIEYLRFHFAHLGSLAVAMGALPVLVEIFGISPLIAQGLIILFIVIASYFVHQYFTFRQPKAF